MRIERDGAYANVVLGPMLAASRLDKRDRAFVTELVYGVTRRHRALDWVLEPFLVRRPPPTALAALRLGAYQLLELDTPSYAAVSETVGAAPRRFRGLINAVLRRVAAAPTPGWPNEATRLSYPDWIVETLCEDLGTDKALAALEAMNFAAPVHRREDSYVQDISSQLVVEAINASEGDLVADLCAAPGGKATALAARGARVVAIDVRPARCRLMQTNRDRLDASSMHVVAGDSTIPPLRAGCFDVALVDAPCTGLGALRRRPDARWRIERGAIARLVSLQTKLVRAAVELLRPGGRLVYSVCTLTSAETVGVAARVAKDSRLSPVEQLEEPWAPYGTGGILLPTTEHDGMAMFAWTRCR